MDALNTFPIVVKTWGCYVQLNQSLIFIFVRKVVLGPLIHSFLLCFGGELFVLFVLFVLILILVVTETVNCQLLVLRLGLGLEPNNNFCKNFLTHTP